MHVESAQQQRRQTEQDRNLPAQGHETGEPADRISQSNDAQILIGNVRDLMGNDTGELARRETSQQSIGEHDGGVMC